MHQQFTLNYTHRDPTASSVPCVCATYWIYACAFLFICNNTFDFTSNEDMTDCNLVLWRPRGEEEKEKEGQRKERRGEEDNIVTESDNSRWLNAVDGRPARECISILLYKTVHAEQKQKKNETQTWGGQVDSLWISVSTCPLHLNSKGLICATTSITQQQQKRGTLFL